MAKRKWTESDYMVKTDTTRCFYCGKEKDGLSFVIGASSKPDWCMIYGTGKMACPDCYEKASKEGSDAVDLHIEAHNKRCREKTLKNK